MKTLVKLLFIVSCLGLVIACIEPNENVEEMTDAELKSAQSHEVTVPFEANLLGKITSLDFEAQECIDEGYAVHVIVECTGNATQMGKVSLVFNFCSGGAPDPDVEGSIYTYAGGGVELVAANGDVLILSSDDGTAIGGRKDTHPEHVNEYWGGEIEVVGGTGKFEGAKGTLTQDDYVSTLDDYTHHRFYGEITLIKGKAKNKGK